MVKLKLQEMTKFWRTIYKVEATKFTEVGYVGRDVESMVRDLVDVSVRLVKAQKKSLVQDEATAKANEKLVKLV